MDRYYSIVYGGLSSDISGHGSDMNHLIIVAFLVLGMLILVIINKPDSKFLATLSAEDREGERAASFVNVMGQGSLLVLAAIIITIINALMG